MTRPASPAKPGQKASLKPRRLPKQARGRLRTRRILDSTARLLEEVGVDGLTTILIAGRLGISVGSLYHYFPNKHAILHALGARWLDEMTAALERLGAMDLENMQHTTFVGLAVDMMLQVYREQRALLPLMQALWSIPELRQLDAEHDEIYVAKMAAMLKRLGLPVTAGERNRLSRTWLHMTHGVLMVIVRQTPRQAARTLADLKRMALTLLDRQPDG